MWSAVFVLAATMGRQIYVDHHHFKIRPNLYITLVGRMALRKTTAMRGAKRMFRAAFPEAPLGSAVMSREQIVQRMAADDGQRTFTDENNQPVLFSPRTFFINELKNFFSIDIGKMIEFLTDIYDEEEVFDSDTIKHGLQPVIAPCVNILACETANWIVDKFRKNIITGGFSRRMLYVHEIERPPRITFPIKTKEAALAEQRCVEHLRKIVHIAGPFSWEPDAKEFFNDWFVNLPDQSDEIMEGYYEAKDVLVTKVAMLLAMAQPEPRLVLTRFILESAIGFIESLEEHLPALTIGTGRNDLAVPQQRLLQLLRDNGGMMPEFAWHRIAGQDMTEGEYAQMKLFFKSTRQLSEALYGNTVMILTRERYEEMQVKGELQ